MKFTANIFTQTVRMLLLLLPLSGIAWAGSRTLSMPAYLAHPGKIIEVPLSLDNAGGLAAMKVQINFDPGVLELQAVTAGPLGEAFEMSQGDGEGLVQLVFARAESLAGGTGRLAVLKFRVNPGAVTDLYSELAIADFSWSDSTGVIDLRQKDTLVTINGQVAVSAQANIDNAHSGLPDWWEEQHGLDLFTNNLPLDPEFDGMSNLMEYAFGGNPNASDDHEQNFRAGRAEKNGESFLSMAFHRRVGDASLRFRLQESNDLSDWEDLDLNAQTFGLPENLGDGTERVKVIGSVPLSGPGTQPHSFLRVVVEKR